MVQALEEKKPERALEIVRKYQEDEQFICAKDESDQLIEKRFQFKYQRFERKGLTLLHYAMLYNCEELMKLLLEKNAGEVLQIWVRVGHPISNKCSSAICIA